MCVCVCSTVDQEVLSGLLVRSFASFPPNLLLLTPRKRTPEWKKDIEIFPHMSTEAFVRLQNLRLARREREKNTSASRHVRKSQGGGTEFKCKCQNIAMFRGCLLDGFEVKCIL